MVKTGFIRDDKIAAIGVMENTNYSWMSAAQDPHDAALGTRRNAGPLVSASVAALDARDHLVAVHGVAQLVGRDKKIAFKILPGRFRNDKTVTIAMRNEASYKQMGIAHGRFRWPSRNIRSGGI